MAFVVSMVPMPRPPVDITFFKGDTRFKGAPRRYRSVLVRPDGVTVQLDGGAYNRIGGPAGEVPHDIAHLDVEETIVMPALWGVVAPAELREVLVSFNAAHPEAADLYRRVPHALTTGERSLVRRSVPGDSGGR